MIRLFGIKMCWLEAVDGDGIVSAIDSNGELFGGALDYRKWSIVGWL